jgi:hypothetical protein
MAMAQARHRGTAGGIEVALAGRVDDLDAAAAGGDRKRAADLAVEDVGHVIAGSAALQCRSCGVG